MSGLREKSRVATQWVGILLAAAWVLGLQVKGAWPQEEITLLHWNDFHSRNLTYQVRGTLGETIRMGGMAILKAYLDSLRAVYPNALLLHAGDEFTGSPICALTKGLSQIDLLNRLQPDAMALGNHEFDYGREILRQRLREAQFPILSANLRDTSADTLFAQPYLIRKVGKVRVGIVGLMTPDLPRLTLPDHVAGLRVEDPIPVMRRYARMLADSADLLIALTHLGWKADSTLAAHVGDIDVIVGGHSHTVLKEPREVNGVIIVQAGSRGRYVGVLRLWVDLERGRVLAYRGWLMETRADRVPPHPGLADRVLHWEKQADRELNVTIGYLKTDWIRRSWKESNIGNWEADVMREFARTDVAFQNSGGIRKDLPAGPITKRDIWEINPFGNHFVVFQVTGQELKAILENNCDFKGEFLQVSGLRYTYDPKKPVGQRIVEVTVGGHPLDPNGTYTVCTNNYLAANAPYALGISLGDRPVQHLSKLDREVFIEAILKQKVVESRVEGRIRKIKGL